MFTYRLIICVISTLSFFPFIHISFFFCCLTTTTMSKTISLLVKAGLYDCKPLTYSVIHLLQIQLSTGKTVKVLLPYSLPSSSSFLISFSTDKPCCRQFTFSTDKVIKSERERSFNTSWYCDTFHFSCIIAI